MFKDSYHEVEDDAAKALLERLNAVCELSDFDPKIVRVLTHPLVFYPGFHFIKLLDHHQNPPKKIHAIYNTDELYIIDGTKTAFETMSEKGLLALNEETIETYIRFFFHYVKAPEGYFYLVDSPDNIPWVEEPTAPARRAIASMLEPLKMKNFDPETGFQATACLFFKNALFISDLDIDLKGNISLSNQELLVDELPAVAHY